MDNRTHSGSYSIRGNMKSDYTDPLTGRSLNSYQFEWAAPEILEQNNEVFVRYWFRVDDTEWNGFNDDSYGDHGEGCTNNPINDHFDGKLLYITDDNDGTVHGLWECLVTVS